MSRSIPTSIRPEPKLRRALELKAKREKRGKNWIISRALENCLGHDEQLDPETEAKRQSRLAAEQDSEDWAHGADFAQWK